MTALAFYCRAGLHDRCPLPPPSPGSHCSCVCECHHPKEQTMPKAQLLTADDLDWEAPPRAIRARIDRRGRDHRDRQGDGARAANSAGGLGRA